MLAFTNCLVVPYAASINRISQNSVNMASVEWYSTTNPSRGQNSCATSEAEIDGKIAKTEFLRAEDIAGIAEFLLKQPSHVTIRELVVLPQAKDF